MQTRKNRKPESDKLTESVQVKLKKHEYKILDRIRCEKGYSSLAAFVRMYLLKIIEGKSQLELF
jgi:hypothetical protein